MDKYTETSLRRFMVSEDTVPLESSLDKKEETVKQGPSLYRDLIVTNHPYFLDKTVKTFLDEDTAINVNNSEDLAPED